jgi:hypothetical protein
MAMKSRPEPPKPQPPPEDFRYYLITYHCRGCGTRFTKQVGTPGTTAEKVADSILLDPTSPFGRLTRTHPCLHHDSERILRAGVADFVSVTEVEDE